MKRVVAGVVCLVAALSPVVVGAEERANSLADGAKAFQVMLEGGLGSGNILFKNHFGTRNALRLGFSGRFSSADEELVVANVGSGDIQSDYISVGADLTYLRYVGPMQSACFYFGAGPFIELSEQTRVRSETEFGVGTYYDSSDDEATTLGILGLIGAEWFIAESLSLAFEYRINAGYRWYTREEEYARPGDPVEARYWEGDSWDVNASRYGRIGLGLYF